MQSLSETLTKVFRARCYEPVPSIRDRSVRELALGPHHIRHRFEFEGGVGLSYILQNNISKNNTLLARLKEKSNG